MTINAAILHALRLHYTLTRLFDLNMFVIIFICSGFSELRLTQKVVICAAFDAGVPEATLAQKYGVTLDAVSLNLHSLISAIHPFKIREAVRQYAKNMRDITSMLLEKQKVSFT